MAKPERASLKRSAAIRLSWLRMEKQTRRCVLHLRCLHALSQEARAGKTSLNDRRGCQSAVSRMTKGKEAIRQGAIPSNCRPRASTRLML
eukprot:3198156-Amphidinium_carterae.1